MNQAQKIREIVSFMFTEDDFQRFPLEFVNIGGYKYKAIKYNALRNYLMDYEEEVFTNGAIIGALQTLDERLSNIYRIRLEGGTYFIYSEDDIASENLRIRTDITDSNDYNNLSREVSQVNKRVSYILKKASNDEYENISIKDLNYLRDILKLANDLENVLERYKSDKTFEKIKSNTEFKDLY